MAKSNTYTLGFFTFGGRGSLGHVGLGLTTGPGLATTMVSTVSAGAGLPLPIAGGAELSITGSPFFCERAKYY